MMMYTPTSHDRFTHTSPPYPMKYATDFVFLVFLLPRYLERIRSGRVFQHMRSDIVCSR
jgi:hypothetical protein